MAPKKRERKKKVEWRKKIERVKGTKKKEKKKDVHKRANLEKGGKYNRKTLKCKNERRKQFNLFSLSIT